MYDVCVSQSPSPLYKTESSTISLKLLEMHEPSDLQLVSQCDFLFWCVFVLSLGSRDAGEVSSLDKGGKSFTNTSKQQNQIIQMVS